MPQRGLLRIGGVVAAAAGLIGVPADFGAGGRLRVVLHRVMPQRLLLHVGGVIAAGAGFVSVPADCGAGGSLCVVVLQIVGIWVGVAVVAIAVSAVGRSGAGRGGGWRVGLGRSLNQFSTAVVERM